MEKWFELPIGGLVTEPATARKVETGKWRVRRPVIDHEKCINCMQCWIYCPDMAIIGKVENGKTVMEGYDYKYCKGCGLCAKICPKKAIEMKPEAEFLK